MTRFVLSRLAQAVLVMAVVSFGSFVLFEYLGDPVENMLGQEATPAEKLELRSELGLDAPVVVRFFAFAAQILRGHLGISYHYGRPVADLLIERAPATIELVLVSALIAVGVGGLLGIYVAIRPNRRTSSAIMAVSLFATSLPTFVTGSLLIYAFAVEAHVLPAFGRGDTVAIGAWTTGLLTISGLKSILLPSVTLAFFQFALILRLVRSEMRDVMREDFIKFARARGLSANRILFRHALRNAALPIVTVVGVNIGNLLAYSVITETVFQWPGLSKLFIDAVQFADVPVLSAYFIMVSATFVAINLIVDLSYLVIDPRIRAGAWAGGAVARQKLA
jgi:peptide/nickel transport system permease protein